MHRVQRIRCIAGKIVDVPREDDVQSIIPALIAAGSHLRKPGSVFRAAAGDEAVGYALARPRDSAG